MLVSVFMLGLRRSWHILACIALLACDEGADSLVGDAGGHDSVGVVDGGKRDGGPSDAPMPDLNGCPAVTGDAELRAVDLHVSLDGESHTDPSYRGHARGAWIAVDGREVFQLQLFTSFDPDEETADDGESYHVTLDLVPSTLLEQTGEEHAINQDIEFNYMPDETTPDRFDFVRTVNVRGGPSHSAFVRRAVLEMPCEQCELTMGTFSQHAGGKFAIERIGPRRFRGTLALRFDGMIPEGFPTSHAMSMNGCFELEVLQPQQCIPGEECAEDCLPEDYACWACGSLYNTHDCGCRPDLPPLDECEQPGRAGLGELCGTEWWCNRSCASGLVCKPKPQDQSESDGGFEGGDALCSYTTCQAP